METDGAAAADAVTQAAAAAGGQAEAANGRPPSESPLPEEEQAAAVAALSATAAAAQAAVAAQQAGAQQAEQQAEPQGAAEAATAAGDAEAAAAAGAELEAAAAPAPARVPARLLYGLSVDEEAPAGQEAPAAPRDGRKQPRLPQLPLQQDDGRLPAYAVGESSWHEPGARPGRKADHADEDPPEGFAPVDVFIGENLTAFGSVRARTVQVWCHSLTFLEAGCDFWEHHCHALLGCLVAKHSPPPCPLCLPLCRRPAGPCRRDERVGGCHPCRGGHRRAAHPAQARPGRLPRLR